MNKILLLSIWIPGNQNKLQYMKYRKLIVSLSALAYYHLVYFRLLFLGYYTKKKNIPAQKSIPKHS